MSKKQTKTREQELKEILENVYNRKCIHQLETFNSIPQLGWGDVEDGINLGIKLGKQIREDEILKIIKRRIKFWTLRKDTINVEPCRNKKVELEELEEEITKQKIKGDDD